MPYSKKGYRRLSRRINGLPVKSFSAYILVFTALWLALTTMIDHHQEARSFLGSIEFRKDPFIPSNAYTFEDRLAFVVPILAKEAASTHQDWIRQWLAVGKPCSEPYKGEAGLFFYVAESDKHMGLALTRFARDHLSIFACFRDISVVSAGLGSAAIDSNAAMNRMFFDLMEKGGFPGYRYVMWMDVNTKPVREFWIDSVFNASRSMEPFWVLGAAHPVKLLVSGTNRTIAATSNIYTNALYNIRAPEFIDFIRLVREREPLKGRVPSFDVLLWKLLNDKPYSTPLLKEYGSLFKTSRFVAVATTSNLDSGLAFNMAPEQYLVDDENHEKYFVRPEMRISVFMRSFSLDLDYAALAFQSAKRFLPYALEYVLVVPETDVAAAKNKVPAFVKICGERPLMRSQKIQQQYSKLMADKYTNGEFVFHLDSDVVLFRPLLHKDLFVLGKPILSYSPYDILPANAGMWRKGTSYCLGQDVPFEYMRTNSLVYPRQAYPSARKFLEKRFALPFIDFMRTRRFGQSEIQELTIHPELKMDKTTQFSEYNFIGAYLHLHMPDAMVFNYNNGKNDGRKPYHDIPNIPVDRARQVCQGNARWGLMCSRWHEEQLNILRTLSLGASDGCGPLDDYWAPYLSGNKTC